MKTRSLSLLAAAAGVALFALAAPQPLSGQNATASTSEMSPQLVALVNEVTAQNKQLAANQTEIEAKLDQIAEAIRQARLFAARNGKGPSK